MTSQFVWVHRWCVMAQAWLFGLGGSWLVPAPRQCLSPVRFFDAPQWESRLPLCHALQGSLLREPSTAVVQSPRRSVPRGVSLSSVWRSVLSPPGLLQLDHHALASVAPFHHATVLPDPDKGHSLLRWLIYSAVQSMGNVHIQYHSHTETNHL